jgi:hypothetical protein
MPAIFLLTGNPFVDAGIFVISELSERRIEDIEVDDLKRLYTKLIDVYFTEGMEEKSYFNLYKKSPRDTQ